MQRLLLTLVLVLAGCLPSRSPQTIECVEFSVQLASGWSKGKDLYTDGVHLVTLKDSVDTLVNFYVYPPKTWNTVAELNDHFFGELSSRLKAQGTLTSGEPTAGELFGRPAMTRQFSFTLPGSTANFDLHTMRMDLGDRVLLILIHVQDRDRTRVLREVAPMLASIKELPAAAIPLPAAESN